MADKVGIELRNDINQKISKSLQNIFCEPYDNTK